MGQAGMPIDSTLHMLHMGEVFGDFLLDIVFRAVELAGGVARLRAIALVMFEDKWF
jgi:hypothetical protein